VRSGGDVLKYRIIDNTVIVSFSQEVLDRMGGGMLIGDLVVHTFALKSYTRDEFTSIMNKIVPEVTVINTPDRPADTITVVGPKSSILRIEKLINSIKSTPEILVETFNLGNLKPDDVEQALKKAVPEATVFAKKESPSSFSVCGNSTTLEKVKKFMEKLNLAPEISYKTISTRETKPEEIEKFLKEALPSVKVVKAVIAGDTMSVTLSGTSSDLQKAEEIINNLEGGKTGEGLAKSVEVFKLKNLQTIAQLQERGVNIPERIHQLVPGVNTSDITVDERTNTIIVKATPSNLEKVKKAIEIIDVKVPQVSIEAMVVDLSSGGGRAFSSSIAEMAGGEKTSLSISPSAGGATIPVRFGILKKDFESVLKGLISQQKAKVLASPKVSTLSGYSATITLQDKVPYQQQQPGGATTGGGGTVVQEAITVWEYENVGITLDILPTVNEDNKIITLKVKPTIQTITSYVTGQRPAVNERTVETLMRIEDGQSIAIGGLVNSTEREEMSKIPIISELPIVGKLFSSKSRVSSDSEIVIIITAKILPY
jgi:type II secretory pathway component GspD/PulD (secretin)